MSRNFFWAVTLQLICELSEEVDMTISIIVRYKILEGIDRTYDDSTLYGPCRFVGYFEDFLVSYALGRTI